MRRGSDFGAFRADKTAKQSRSDTAFLKERARIRAENDEKTARLRKLRLAKEAVEREAAAQAEAEKANQPAKAPRRKRAPSAITPSAA